MTDEERQRTMDFIVAQQTQFAVNCDKAEVRVSRLERVVKLMIKAGMRARVKIRDQDERFDRRFTTLLEAQANCYRRIEALADSQARSDRRLDALIDTVKEQREGNA